jgi:hypothetical protein
MIFDTIKNAVGPTLGRAALATKNYSPELYLAGGLLAGGAAIIMLAKAHKRSDEVLDPTIQEIQRTKDYVLEQNVEAVQETGHEAISKMEAQSIMKPLYGALVLDAVKLYGPGVVMGIGSVALILASHGVLRNRNRALISSVALLERGWNTYRKRVIDEYGKETDERLYYGADSRTVVSIEETEDGKTKKVKRQESRIPENPQPLKYGRLFDNSVPRWSPDRARNETVLRMAQSTMNTKLDLYGVVFLNDVYEELGFRRTAVGAVAGWLTHDESDAAGLPRGDGFVDFGLDKSINRNEGDNRWMLDFNVQGNILKGVGNVDAPEIY